MSNRAPRTLPPRTSSLPPSLLPSAARAASPPAVQAAAPYQLVATRRGPMLVNRNDVYMGRAFLKYGECCEAELSLLLQLLKMPGLVVEVGANMGIFAVPLALELARQGRSLLALEPQPVIFQQLCANFALNGLTNVSALPYACGSTGGMVTFGVPDYLTPNNFGGLSMVPPRETTARTESAPCLRLDDLVPTAPVGLVKIDVEGQELAVLQGAEAILARSKPVLYVENDRVDVSPQLIQWLWDHGYDCWWHIPPLFNPQNFFAETENIYGAICSYNMLCLPSAGSYHLESLTKVIDADAHPLKPS